MGTLSIMRISLIAGGAGFIGVNLCRRLLEEKNRMIVVVDNFSRGRRDFFKVLSNSERLRVINCDLSLRGCSAAAFAEAVSFGPVDEVWHLAANSDIPAGVKDADVDVKDTFSTTVELLRCMQTHSIGALHFASSSAIYGDHGDRVLHEETGPLLPISNYGAMKLASEAIISSAAESFLSRASLFRFPNVVGVPATHGVILDFIRKLKIDFSRLEVLGDGTQRKAYMHVTDLISAMLFVRSLKNTQRTLAVNVGPIDEGVYVRWIAEQVIKRVAPSAKLSFGTGNRGWVGDVPTFRYSTSKIQSLGWAPSLSSKTAVLRAIDEIASQEGV